MQALQIPADIQTIDAFLGQMLLDLTDVMADEVREWRSELRSAVKEWKIGGPQPDWQGFREWMNDICYEDGMPALFPTIEEE
jgi:hypothetical protein